MNQTLEQYLCIYYNYQQDNWSELLPLVEFLYNNASNATTGVSPFFTNKGYHPNISVHPEWDLTSKRAWEYSIDLDSLQQFLHEEMTAVQLWYQGPADARWTLALDFKISDQAFIKAKYFCTTRPLKKLTERNLEPFTIITQPGTHSIILWLLDSMKSIHSIFHILQLEPVTPNMIPNCMQTPPPLVNIDSETEYEIKEILDLKINCRHWKCKLLYLVCWSGYKSTDEETSWLLADELGHVSELVHDFHLQYSDKPGPHSA